MSENLNKKLIEEYKGEYRIISDYYKLVKNNQIFELNGIINPLKIDNRQIMSPTDNQKDYPACAGFSAATLVESMYWKRTGKLKQLDSLQVYQLAKQNDGAVEQYGTFLEFSCEAVLNLCKKDPEFQFLNDAKIKLFYNDQTLNTIEYTKHLLHSYDFLQVGFNIDEGWYDCNNQNYILRPRGKNLGGHAVLLCGYNKTGFIVQNQWGINWGTKGFCIIPYDLFLKQFMYGAYITIGE